MGKRLCDKKETRLEVLKIGNVSAYQHVRWARLAAQLRFVLVIFFKTRFFGKLISRWNARKFFIILIILLQESESRTLIKNV
jgi:hypothetical protein